MPWEFEGFIARVMVFASASVFAVLSNHLILMWSFLKPGVRLGPSMRSMF